MGTFTRLPETLAALAGVGLLLTALSGTAAAQGRDAPWPGTATPGQASAKPAQPSPSKPPGPAAQRRHRLEAVKSWGYQLRLIRFPEIAASPLDLVVIDHALSAGRRFVHQFAPDLVDIARRKPDGEQRIVLAYMSIGEAERYRFYWDQNWYDPARKPAWLGDINPVWDGNYLARFWHPEWQRIILEGPDSYLGRIQAAGYDGVYLDRADVFSEWTKEKPDAEAAMAAFIARIGSVARRNDPNFLVVLQNAEELVRRKPVLEAIDGIAKEDLYFGIDHKASPNDSANVAASLKYLRQAKRAGRAILVVEYLDEAEKAAAARRRAEAEGFVIHFTRRDLGDLMVEAPDQPRPRTNLIPAMPKR